MRKGPAGRHLPGEALSDLRAPDGGRPGLLRDLKAALPALIVIALAIALLLLQATSR